MAKVALSVHRRRAALLITATLLFVGCDGRQADTDGRTNDMTDVFFIVKSIEEKWQSAPGSMTTYHEVEVVVDVGNRGRTPLRFDQLRAVFRAGNKPMSAGTYILKEDAVVATYALEEDATTPNVAAEGVFEIEYGYASRFVLSSANSNFGLLAPGSPRNVVVTLHSQGQVLHGPFTIDLPWPK